MTLRKLIDMVRSATGDLDGSGFTDSQIIQTVEIAIKAMQSDVIKANPSAYNVSTTIIPTAGTFAGRLSKSFSVSLLTSVLADIDIPIVKIWASDGVKSASCRFIEKDTLARMVNNSYFLPVMTQPYYTRIGDTFHILPVSVNTLSITYYREPIVVNDYTTALDIPYAAEGNLIMNIIKSFSPQEVKK